jgi:SAM-dependent methyltransferase
MIGALKKQLKKVAHPAIRKLRPAPQLMRKPLSTRWGTDRGTPVDHHFLQRFMESNRGDITGSVLEIKNRFYTDSLGHDVEKSDVLDIDPSNKEATIIADLSAANDVPSNTFDCFVLTETLQYIYDFKKAAAHAYRILKPGGVLLATVPCISPIDRELEDAEMWRFTKNSCQRLFGDLFGHEQVQAETYGNYFSCTAWLSGMALEEIETSLLDEKSDVYIQGVCVRAQKKED